MSEKLPTTRNMYGDYDISQGNIAARFRSGGTFRWNLHAEWWVCFEGIFKIGQHLAKL